MRDVRNRDVRSALVFGIVLANGAHALAQGVTWTQATPAQSPSARWDHAMAYDGARQRVVLFGGFDGTFRWNDTWEWDGVNWTNATPSSSPSARSGHAMAFDGTRQRVVLFGGWDGTSLLNDTWEWNGVNWTNAAPSSSPSGRSGHAMAYDVARRRLVLFGGNRAGRLNDTWEWDGVSWANRGISFLGPCARAEHAVTYDTARQLVVLFGGLGTRLGRAFLLADTWEWDGTSWSQGRLAFFQAPSARLGHAMTYDASRQRTVMFGGQYVSVTIGGMYHLLAGTWQRLDRTWYPAMPAQILPARMDHAMVYDAERQRVVLFGGTTGGATGLADTWELHAVSPATFAGFGVGCPGSMGIPSLNAAPFSLPWLGDTFSVELGNVPAGSFPFMVLGFNQTSNPVPGLPGCTQLVTLNAIDLLTSSGNVARWTKTVPVSTGLVGWSLFFQGAVLNAGSGLPFGAAVSNGGQATIGMR